MEISQSSYPMLADDCTQGQSMVGGYYTAFGHGASDGFGGGKDRLFALVTKGRNLYYTDRIVADSNSESSLNYIWHFQKF